MDHEIYGKPAARNDLGIYVTRRIPKGGGSPAVPNGPTQPTDPNANPVTISRQYSAAAVAPHSGVTRWSYTVPPKRRAQLQSAFVQSMRDIAAVTPNGSTNMITIRRAGTDQTAFFTLVQAHFKNGALGTNHNELHTGAMEFFEGDFITGQTQDTSVDGSISYVNSIHMIEYDALHRAVGADYHSVVGASPSAAGAGGGGLFGAANTGGQWKYPTAAVMTRDRGGNATEIRIAGDTGIVPRRLMNMTAG